MIIIPPINGDTNQDVKVGIDYANEQFIKVILATSNSLLSDQRAGQLSQSEKSHEII